MLIIMQSSKVYIIYVILYKMRCLTHSSIENSQGLRCIHIFDKRNRKKQILGIIEDGFD